MSMGYRAKPVTFQYERHHFNIFAGPYRLRPQNTFGVLVAAEINNECNIKLHLRDFGVPSLGQTIDWQKGVELTIRAGLRGDRPYVGCMGGLGRTGLMLASVAKALGEEHPVLWIRTRYRREAVETVEQQRFIEALDVEPIRAALRRRRLLRRLTLGLVPW